MVVDSGDLTEKVTQVLLEKGMQPGDGYGAARKTQLRFANFPTHAKEHFELLVDTLESM
jgi:phosphoserine aminotransferase